MITTVILPNKTILDFIDTALEKKDALVKFDLDEKEFLRVYGKTKEAYEADLAGLQRQAGICRKELAKSSEQEQLNDDMKKKLGE